MIRLLERVCLVAALVCLSLICAVGARAQNTADVVGTVTDASGGVLPGATVTLTNTETNISQSTQTSSGGEYVFTLLQVGSYTVKVEAKGFKTYSDDHLSVIRRSRSCGREDGSRRRDANGGSAGGNRSAGPANRHFDYWTPSSRRRPWRTCR